MTNCLETRVEENKWRISVVLNWEIRNITQRNTRSKEQKNEDVTVEHVHDSHVIDRFTLFV